MNRVVFDSSSQYGRVGNGIDSTALGHHCDDIAFQIEVEAGKPGIASVKALRLPEFDL
jgi:hypothetical protein